MKRFFSAFLGTFTALVLMVAIVASVISWMAKSSVDVPDDAYLLIDLFDVLPEYDPPGTIQEQLMGEPTETLQQILTNLDKAGIDERIKGVILRVGPEARVGTAAIEEIHGAIARLQKTGKKVYGWTQAVTTRSSLLLAACDEVIALPVAPVLFTGFDIQTTHIKRMLDKLGIIAELHKIKDFKSAAEMLMREDMSEPARENRRWIADENWTMFIKAMQTYRNIPEEKINALMQQGLMSAEEALKNGLVDALMYWSQLEAKLKQAEDEELVKISSIQYADVDPLDLGLQGEKTIVVVHAQGMIQGRKNDVNPIFGTQMGYESVCRELRRARLDKEVAAVVFRIDSGGGSVVASDIMAHEVQITDGIKPVVASMANVAASGGYYIAYRARKIIANTMTITGSIGSIAGKFNLKGLYDTLGITHDHVTKGPNATIFSDHRNFTPEERERFEQYHWSGFNQWLQDVAKYRKMSLEQAEQLAHGRVWTGRQTKENGLIDEIGDLNRAVELAKELAGIPATEQVTIKHYPERKDLLDKILNQDPSATVTTRRMIHKLVKNEINTTLHILTKMPQQAFQNLAYGDLN